MTICFYLLAAFEKGRPRSPEAGLEVFRLRVGLVGLVPVRPQPALRPDGDDPAGGDRPGAAGAGQLGGRAGREPGGGDGGLARPGRVRVQDRRGAVPPVGARRLRRGPRAGVGLGGVGVEAGERRRADEGADPGARAVRQRPRRPARAGVRRRGRGAGGGLDDLRQLRRARAAQPQADAGLLVDRARRLPPRRGPGGERLGRPGGGGGSVLFYLSVYAFTTVGAFAVATWLVRDGGSDDIDDLDGLGARSPVAGGLRRLADALVDRLAAAGRVLRQAVHVHGSSERRPPLPPDVPLARDARACSTAWSRPSTMPGSCGPCSSARAGRRPAARVVRDRRDDRRGGPGRRRVRGLRPPAGPRRRRRRPLAPVPDRAGPPGSTRSPAWRPERAHLGRSSRGFRTKSRATDRETLDGHHQYPRQVPRQSLPVPRRRGPGAGGPLLVAGGRPARGGARPPDRPPSPTRPTSGPWPTRRCSPASAPWSTPGGIARRG